MQTNLKRGNAAFRMRGVGLSLAILASTTLSLSAPDRALAGCGGASRPAGVRPAVSGTAGVHAATGIAVPSGGGGGGGGTLGCAGGSSVSAMRGLPTTGSGRVVEAGARTMGHPTTRARTASNASAHVHAVRAPHRA
jgi:hypothetical protein